MKKITKQEFIDNSNIIHNNKYDYSLVNLINTSTKVKILCQIHGVFEQTPTSHISGSGCNKCSYIKRYDNTRLDSKKFIIKANEQHHKKYDYSLVEYKTYHKKVLIICKSHGVFEQEPAHHLRGRGCPKCGNDVKSKEFFLNKSKKIHGDKYDYSLVNFINTKIKVKILCPIHGAFIQIPRHHYNGAGCPKCRESKGEREIRKFLTNKGIQFISQKRFSDCKDKRPLPFDFYLPDYNTCIEYDGEQHFRNREFFGGKEEFINRIKKDRIKTEYCKNNNIKLIRVKKINKIEKIKL